MRVVVTSSNSTEVFEKNINDYLKALENEGEEVVEIKYNTTQIPGSAVNVFHSAMIIYE